MLRKGRGLPLRIRCGDLYKPTDASAERIDDFSECSISEHHCVAQRKLHCQRPERLPAGPLELQSLTGTWYITKGWRESHLAGGGSFRCSELFWGFGRLLVLQDSGFPRNLARVFEPRSSGRATGQSGLNRPREVGTSSSIASTARCITLAFKEGQSPCRGISSSLFCRWSILAPSRGVLGPGSLMCPCTEFLLQVLCEEGLELHGNGVTLRVPPPGGSSKLCTRPCKSDASHQSQQLSQGAMSKWMGWMGCD